MFAPVRKKRFVTDSTSSGEGHGEKWAESKIRRSGSDESDNEGVWLSENPQGEVGAASSESDSDSSSDSESEGNSSSSTSSSSSSSSSSEATPEPGDKVGGVEGKNKSKSLGGEVLQSSQARVTIHSDVEEFDSGTESEEEKMETGEKGEEAKLKNEKDSHSSPSLTISILRDKISLPSQDPKPASPEIQITVTDSPPGETEKTPFAAAHASNETSPRLETPKVASPSVVESGKVNSPNVVNSPRVAPTSANHSPIPSRGTSPCPPHPFPPSQSPYAAVAMPTLNPLLPHHGSVTPPVSLATGATPPFLSPLYYRQSFPSSSMQVPPSSLSTPSSIPQSDPAPFQGATPFPSSSTQSSPYPYFFQYLLQRQNLANMSTNPHLPQSSSSASIPPIFPFYPYAYRSPSMPQLTPIPNRPLLPPAYPWQPGMLGMGGAGVPMTTTTSTSSTGQPPNTSS